MVEKIGGVALVVGAVFKMESYQTVNGELESYSNMPATIAGVIALICGVIALTMLAKTSQLDKNKRIVTALVLVIGAGVHLARGQGFFFQGNEGGESSSFDRIGEMDIPVVSGPSIAERAEKLSRAIDACEADPGGCVGAVTLARALCDDAPKEGCDELALLLMENRLVEAEPDFAGAFAAATKGCDAGGQMACTNLAVLYFQGQGVTADPAKAVELTTAACDADNGVACKNLGFNYESNLKDFTNARVHYRKACDLGNGAGCRLASSLLHEERGGPIDKPGAVALGRKGCELGDASACNMAGHLLAEGDGVPQDEPAALQLFEKACQFGLGSGCTNLGIFLKFGRGTSENANGAFTNFEKGCSMDDSSGCYRAGSGLWRGDGVALDRERAAKMFGRACELGEEAGCKLPKE